MRAIVDLGTNSVRLLVAEQANGTIKPILRETRVTRLGYGVGKIPVLSREGMERTLQALEEYQRLVPAGTAVVALATSAVRDATNREQFQELVKRRTGWELRVLSGQEEAELSFKGALLALPILTARPLAVVDIGGGSTEIYTGDNGGKLLGGGSSQVGAVRMLEAFISQHPVLDAEWQAMEREIRRVLKPLIEQNLQFNPQSLVAVGGTASSLAALLQNLESFSYEKVSGFTIGYRELGDLTAKLTKLSLAERSLLPSLQKGREDVIICGASILLQTMDLLGFTEVIVSNGDLLYGSV